MWRRRIRSVPGSYLRDDSLRTDMLGRWDNGKDHQYMSAATDKLYLGGNGAQQGVANVVGNTRLGDFRATFKMRRASGSSGSLYMMCHATDPHQANVVRIYHGSEGNTDAPGAGWIDDGTMMSCRARRSAC